VTDTGSPDGADTATPHPGQAGIHRRLVMGWSNKLVGLGISFGEQFLLVPVFLIFWGPELYGDWLVLFSAAGMIALIDFGLQTYYANAFQMAISRDDQEAFHRLLHQASALYIALIAIALPLIGLVAYAGGPATSMNLQTVGIETASTTFLLLLLFFLANIPLGAVMAIYRAHGHFATGIMVGNISRLLLVGAIALTLYAGSGPVVLAMVFMAILTGNWVAVMVHQKRRYRGLRYGLTWPDRTARQELFRIAPFYAIVPAAMMLTIHGTIVMISALGAAGQAIVTFTALRTLTGVARQSMDQLLQVTGAEFARQFAQDDTAGLAALYDFVGRMAGGLCGALAGLITVIAPPFLLIWTVGKVPFDPQVFWPLLAVAALAGPSIAGYAVLHCVNRPQGMAGAYGASSCLTLGLCLILIPEMGAAGAAWSVLIAEIGVLSLIIPRATAKIVGGSFITRIASTQLFALTAFSISAASAWLAQRLIGSDSLIQIVAIGLLWCLMVTPPLYYLVFEKGKRRWIADRIRTAISK
jgi:O-antigen/teichoic acid export membrane protein